MGSQSPFHAQRRKPEWVKSIPKLHCLLDVDLGAALSPGNPPDPSLTQGWGSTGLQTQQAFGIRDPRAERGAGPRAEVAAQ